MRRAVDLNSRVSSRLVEEILWSTFAMGAAPNSNGETGSKPFHAAPLGEQVSVNYGTAKT